MLRSISLLLLLALAGVAEAQPRVERPTWQVGDRWVRSDGAWDLVRIENDRYVFSNGPGSEMHFTRNLALVQYTRAPRGFAFEPAIDLQWPLKVGQFASGDVRWTTRNCPRRLPSADHGARGQVRDHHCAGRHLQGLQDFAGERA